MLLSDSQRKTYDFICRYVKKHGYSPKLSEIAKELGIQSRGVVHRYVQALVEQELIQVESYRHRGITLTSQSTQQHSSLPLLGYIAAGQPIEAIRDQQMIELSDLFVGNSLFILKVRGDSMVEEGILEGDLIVCDERSTANNNQIVVALIDDADTTLKRLWHNADDTITLFPANKNMQPMIYHSSRITVQGIFVGLLRVNVRS